MFAAFFVKLQGSVFLVSMSFTEIYCVACSWMMIDDDDDDDDDDDGAGKVGDGVLIVVFKLEG